jgi:large subunit ribosomal protein L9
MKQVTILLRENVKDLGLVGDVVKVAAGYARNYLLPSRQAVQATPDNVKMMERRRVRMLAEMALKDEQIAEQIAAFGKLKLVATEKADETGSLYGSVTAARISELLIAAGHNVDEKSVRLEEPIKNVGTHEVPVHLFGEHYAGIQVVVEAIS